MPWWPLANCPPPAPENVGPRAVNLGWGADSDGKVGLPNLDGGLNLDGQVYTDLLRHLIISRISVFILGRGLTEFWSSEVQTFSVFIEDIVNPYNEGNR